MNRDDTGRPNDDEHDENDSRFATLWTDFLEGDLAAEELAELEQLLAASPQLQSRAADLLQTHRLLGFAMQQSDAADDHFVRAVMNDVPQSDSAFTDSVMRCVDERASVGFRSDSVTSSGLKLLATVVFKSHSLRLEAPASSKQSLFAKARAFAERKPTLGAALVLLVIAFVGLLAVWSWQPGVRIEVVKVSEGVSEEWAPGSHVNLRQLKLVRGDLQFKLPSDVLLDVHAPAELSFVDAMNVRVVAGKVTADVGERGKGFVLETPQARVVDLGTRFGVDASDSKHTDVVVFQGQVELYQPGASERVALLHQGEALRVTSHRRTSRILNVSGSEESGGWSTNGKPAVESIITAVRDSMSTDEEGVKKWPSLRNYYRIIPGGMREDAQAYADSFHEWNGLDERGLPEELLGADLVQTFSADGLNWWMQITLTVSRPCTVYVFADRRAPPPQWLGEHFTDTGIDIAREYVDPKLGVGQRGPGIGKKLFPFGVWKLDVKQAGEVTLGPPYFEKIASPTQVKKNSMYGIAVK